MRASNLEAPLVSRNQSLRRRFSARSGLVAIPPSLSITLGIGDSHRTLVLWHAKAARCGGEPSRTGPYEKRTKSMPGLRFNPCRRDTIHCWPSSTFSRFSRQKNWILIRQQIFSPRHGATPGFIATVERIPLVSQPDQKAKENKEPLLPLQLQEIFPLLHSGDVNRWKELGHEKGIVKALTQPQSKTEPSPKEISPLTPDDPLGVFRELRDREEEKISLVSLTGASKGATTL